VFNGCREPPSGDLFEGTTALTKRRPSLMQRGAQCLRHYSTNMIQMTAVSATVMPLEIRSPRSPSPADFNIRCLLSNFPLHHPVMLFSPSVDLLVW